MLPEYSFATEIAVFLAIFSDWLLYNTPETIMSIMIGSRKPKDMINNMVDFIDFFRIIINLTANKYYKL